MAKQNIVTKKQLEKSGFDNLRDYMNAFKFDAAKNKYVEREKKLVRKEVKPDNNGKAAAGIIADSRSNRSNINPFAKSTAAKRADALNMDPNAKSTRSDSSKVIGARNLVTEKKKKSGNPVFGLKKGGVVSKGGSVRKAAKKKNIDGIAKKGKTKGRII